MMEKIKIRLKDSKNLDNPYVQIKVQNRFGKIQYVDMHGYLVGMEAAFFLKKKHEFHNLVILTGDVGAGKSTLIEGQSGVNATFSKQQLTFDNISWATEKFIQKTDAKDNIESPLWWDESIQGATGRQMAISSLGNKLKIAFVTKRFKKHTYYLAVDEINEYAWKLIKMADAWIHVKKIGLTRGYFNVYTDKRKIKFIYNGFKFHNKDWTSKEIKSIWPDCKGKFENYRGLFLDPNKYDQLKLEETQQIEKAGGIQWSNDKVKCFYFWSQKWKLKDIGKETGVPIGTIKTWSANEFKSVVEDVK